MPADAIRKRVEALAAEGRRTELDLERAKLQAARARQKLLNANSDRDLDLLELKRLIGWPGSAPLTLAADPDLAMPELPSSENLSAARAADPELQSLSREVELLGRSAKLESKRFAPIIEASAQYQRLGQYNDFDKYYVTFTPDSVAVGVSIAIPLFTGGRFEDGRRRARARLVQVEAQQAARESDLELAVRRAEANVARATAEKSLNRRSRGIEEETVSALQMLVREGRSELTDLDERQIVLADADEEAVRADLDSLLERARLLSLRGELARALIGTDPPCLMPVAALTATQRKAPKKTPVSRRERDGVRGTPFGRRDSADLEGPPHPYPLPPHGWRGGSSAGRLGELGSIPVRGQELREDLVVVGLLAQPGVLAGEIGEGQVRAPRASRRSCSGRPPSAGRGAGGCCRSSESRSARARTRPRSFRRSAFSAVRTVTRS